LCTTINAGALIGNGDINKAIKNYRHAIEINPQQPESVYFNLGRLLTEQEKYGQSISIYKAALKIYPENEKIYQYLGKNTEAKGEIDKAIKNYRHAIKINPQQPEWVYFNLGRLLTAQGKYDECITTYQAALKIYSKNEKLYQSLGRNAEEKGDIDLAIRNYKQAIELNPKQPTWVYFHLGQLLTGQEKVESAIAVHQASIEQYPNNAEAYRLLGVAQEKSGNIDGIIASYRQAIALEPDKQVWIYSALGQLLSKQERFEEAINLYEDADQVFPENPEVYRQLGRVQNQAGQLDAAAESFQKAIKIEPDKHIWIYFALGQLLSKQGRFEEAINLYQDADRIFPENPEVYRQLGRVQQQADQLDAAAASFHKAIEIEPDKHIWIYVELGQLLSKQERFEEALAIYQDADSTKGQIQVPISSPNWKNRN
jgi:tetratricopeptide (TPR) repeat protein